MQQKEKKHLLLLAIIFVFCIKSSGQSYSGFDEDIDSYTRLLNLPAMAVGVAKGDSLIFLKVWAKLVPASERQ